MSKKFPLRFGLINTHTHTHTSLDMRLWYLIKRKICACFEHNKHIETSNGSK